MRIFACLLLGWMASLGAAEDRVVSAAETAYAKGDLVNYLGVAYRRSVAGTSGATFSASNWQQITPSVGTTAGTLMAGNRITSGTAAPSGGTSGDIHLRYSP
jgi:hypothetical protein